MRENKEKKAYSKVVNRRLVPMIALTVLLVMCLFSYKFSKPSRWFDGNSARLISQKSKSRELEQILRRASMMDNTVILSIVDEEWASSGSVLDLFLESFQIGKETQRLLHHLVIVTLGSQAFQYCITLHPYCFQLNTSIPKLASNYYLRFWRQRNNLLLEIIELGYNLIFTEADVMWFKDPIKEFHNEYEVSIPCDGASSQSESNDKACTRGLFFVKSNDVTVDFFRFWTLVGYLYPNSHFESLCEILAEQEVVEVLNVRVKYLDTAYFGGFCQQNNISGVYTMHANCCDNNEKKVYELRLVLDDWKHFTTRSSNARTIAILERTKQT